MWSTAAPLLLASTDYRQLMATLDTPSRGQARRQQRMQRRGLCGAAATRRTGLWESPRPPRPCAWGLGLLLRLLCLLCRPPHVLLRVLAVGMPSHDGCVELPQLREDGLHAPLVELLALSHELRVVVRVRPYSAGKLVVDGLRTPTEATTTFPRCHTASAPGALSIPSVRGRVCCARWGDGEGGRHAFTRPQQSARPASPGRAPPGLQLGADLLSPREARDHLLDGARGPELFGCAERRQAKQTKRRVGTGALHSRQQHRHTRSAALASLRPGGMA